MSEHRQRTGFTFKKFHVAHDHCAMKVGTDAILLGAWAPIEGISRVLDIGTGSGIISLMLAQRSEGKLHIDALDINKQAAVQAQENIQHSPWPTRIHAHHGSLQDYVNAPYDLLVSNPPYFLSGQILSCPARQAARHTQHLSHTQLLNDAARLSHTDSSMALVLPIDAAEIICRSKNTAGWHLHACCSIIPKPAKPANRQLLLFRRTASADLIRTELTIRNADQTYSSEYTNLCRDFYLKM